MEDRPADEASQSNEVKNLTAVLRHGCSSCRTTCDTTKVPDIKVGDDVVVRTERGVEYALILTAPEEATPGQPRPHVEVLRHAHIEDLRRQAEIDREGRSVEYRYCMERIRARVPGRIGNEFRVLWSVHDCRLLGKPSDLAPAVLRSYDGA